MSILDKIIPKKETKEYFLTLGVEEHHIQAAIAKIFDDQVVIIGSGTSEFSAGENETEAADIAISTAEKNLPENILVEKVIFALPPNYIEKDKVKSEYLTRLKKITKELNLKPHGFVEYPAAISFYLEKFEGSPPTLLLLSVGKTHLSFFLIRVGKVHNTIVVKRTSTIASDFEQVLPEFKAELLPSRILLYDEGENMEETREELLRFPWHKHSTFLHTPKIEILGTLKVLTAIVEAGASSLLPSAQKLREVNFEQETSPTKTTEPIIGVQLDEITSQEKASVQKSAQIKHPKALKVEKDEKAVEFETANEETFGFVKGKDIREMEAPTTPPTKSFSFPKFSFFKMPKFNFPFKSNATRIALIGAIVLLLVGAVFFYSVFKNYSKATLSLIVYPVRSNAQVEVVFNTSGGTAENKNTVQAHSISEEISGSKTASTSGSAKVGEKAKGVVVVYNKTTSRKTFPKDTLLSNGDLKFTLDEEVSVASASDTGEGLSFGKTNVPVTAESLGPEGNLATGSIFVFKDFPESSYSGKNTAGFTGGTSRDVPSVSKQDQADLENGLTEELLASAKQQLSQKLTVGEKLLDGSIVQSEVTKKFSGNVGSEAKELTLNFTIKATALSFRETDLISLATNLTSPPAGYSLDALKTGIKVNEASKDKDGNIVAKATITTYFLPQLDTESLKSKIVGKNYDEAATFLRTVSGVAGVKITQESSLPLLKNKLPSSKDNISINTISY